MSPAPGPAEKTNASVSDQDTYDDFPITVHDYEGNSVDQAPQLLRKSTRVKKGTRQTQLK